MAQHSTSHPGVCLSENGAAFPGNASKPSRPVTLCFSFFWEESPQAHTAPVSDMMVDPSGSVVAFGSADRSVTVHDVQGGFRTHTFRGHKSVLTLFIGRCVWRHRSIVMRVVFHPTEAELASCSQDHTVKIWDLQHAKLKTTLKVGVRQRNAVDRMSV